MRINTLAAAIATAALIISTAPAGAAAPMNQSGTVFGGGVFAPAGPKGASQQAPTPATYAPLTSQECEGLGGTVVFSSTCASKGVFACSTVDPHGVIRSVCLSK